MAAHQDSSRLSLRRAMAAGLGAGAVAAIVSALVSLLLRSPDRVFMNAASISVAALLAGLLGGLAYHSGSASRHATRNLIVWLVGAFLVVAVIALALQMAPSHLLPDAATFCIPLAAVALLLLGLLTPLFVRPSQLPVWLGPAAGVVALGVGIALFARTAGAGGRLALPKASSSASTAGAGGLLRPSDVAGLAFVVDPGQSKASWTVREKLANLPAPDDAVGTTSGVAGTIYLDGRPSTVTVNVQTFKSDNAGRDRHLLTDPGLGHYAPAQFTSARLDLPGSYKPGDTLTRQVQGTMTLNNVAKPMTFDVQARLENNTLFVHGASDFTFEDFNMPQPKFSQLVSIDDTIHAEILLVAKPQQ